MVPSTLLTCVTATSFTLPSASTSSSSSSEIRPSSDTCSQRSVAPFSAATICHGTMFEWCSIWVRTIWSPGPMFWRAHV